MEQHLAVAVTIAAAAAAALYILTARSHNRVVRAEFPLFEPAEDEICRLAAPLTSTPVADYCKPVSVAQSTVAEPTVAEPKVAEPTVAEPTVAEPSVAEPTATASVPAPVVTSSSAAAAAAAPIIARLAPLLDELRLTLAGSEERRLLVIELVELLTTASTLAGKAQRNVAREFADNDGPEICYEMESCMNGDWVRDAKNGTMSKLSNISRLPGPIGQSFFAYRGQREKLKADAASEVGCNRPHPALSSADEMVDGSSQLPIITAPNSMASGSTR